MANRTFKYIDKERVIPIIEERITEYTELINICGKDEYLEGKIDALRRLGEEFIDGLYDWQPAE